MKYFNFMAIAIALSTGLPIVDRVQAGDVGSGDRIHIAQASDAQKYFNLARSKEKAGDDRGALENYDKAIEFDPKYANAYNNRALLKKNKLKDFNGALADYSKAVELEPKLATAYYNRAVLYEELNDIPAALADYDRAIAIAPNADIYNNRALLKEQKLKDLQGALADYNKAVALTPKTADVYYNRADLKQKLNDKKGAASDYEIAIALDPTAADIDPQFTVANPDRIAVNLGANPTKIETAKQAIAYNRTARNKESKGDLPGALADLDRAIAISPKSALAHHNRAVLKYERLKDTQGAIADFRQAAKLFRIQNNESGLKNTLDSLKAIGVNN